MTLLSLSLSRSLLISVSWTLTRSSLLRLPTEKKKATTRRLRIGPRLLRLPWKSSHPDNYSAFCACFYLSLSGGFFFFFFDFSGFALCVVVLVFRVLVRERCSFLFVFLGFHSMSLRGIGKLCLSEKFLRRHCFHLAFGFGGAFGKSCCGCWKDDFFCWICVFISLRALKKELFVIILLSENWWVSIKLILDFFIFILAICQRFEKLDVWFNLFYGPKRAKVVDLWNLVIGPSYNVWYLIMNELWWAI